MFYSWCNFPLSIFFIVTYLPFPSSLKSTPLLLAANAGALAGVKCLIQLGAHIGRQDEAGNNIVHLAALRFHTNVLEFFIEWNHPDVKVWEILVGKRIK